MLRSRVVCGALALIALSAPTGVATAGTEPDDSSPEPAAAEDTPPTGTAAEESGAVGDDGGEGITAPSPEDIEYEIDMMLGLVPEEEMEQHWAEQAEEQQLSVQACMNESGFDYEIENYPTLLSGPGGLEMGTPEFAEQYGFGIWTTMDPALSAGDMAIEYTSPNDDMVNSLSPQEQNAWYEVKMECLNDTYSDQDNVFGNPDVQQIVDDFWSDVDNDPRMREARAGWVDCMEEAGFPYPSPDDMYEDVSAGDDETFELHNRFYESEAWLDGSEDHAEWLALVDHEIEVAVANAACEPAVSETREQVQRDLRDDLVAVWQTIDWSQPPVTAFGGETEVIMPGETIEVIETIDVDVTETSGSPPVALDLSAPATTEP